MLKTKAVLGVAFVLALATIAVVTQLHARADASRDAQVKLANVEKALGQLEELPWEADPEQAGPARTRTRMQTAQRRVENELAELPAGASETHLTAARDQFRASVAALNQHLELVARQRPEASEAGGVVEERL